MLYWGSWGSCVWRCTIWFLSTYKLTKLLKGLHVSFTLESSFISNHNYGCSLSLLNNLEALCWFILGHIYSMIIELLSQHLVTNASDWDGSSWRFCSKGYCWAIQMLAAWGLNREREPDTTLILRLLHCQISLAAE